MLVISFYNSNVVVSHTVVQLLPKLLNKELNLETTCRTAIQSLARAVLGTWTAIQSLARCTQLWFLQVSAGRDAWVGSAPLFSAWECIETKR